MTTSVPCTYHLIPSSLGEVGVVRGHRQGRLLIRAILLPRKGRRMADIIAGAFPGAVPEDGGVGDFNRKLKALLAGRPVDIEIGEFDFEGIGGFARRVLLADYRIPRGKVMTYGGLAASVGIPGGARAVGNVMAANPFPLVIPCHRVIRSDGNLGGFGGGLPMKRALLVMEGVGFDRSGRVLANHIDV